MNSPTPGPTEYYQYWIISASVIVALKHALDLWKTHLRPADLDARLDHLVADFEHKSELSHRTSAAAREKISESIRALERGLAALQKETELLAQQLHHLDAKLDRLIERKT